MLVEMHSHVIYGVDDGAQTYETMVGLLQQAVDSGVRHLVCTSHITPGFKEFPMDAYQRRLGEAQKWCRENAPELQLHTGSEVLYTKHASRLLGEGQVPTLNRTKLVLMEFFPDAKEKEIFDAVTDIGAYGYRVVLAHVERYEALRKRSQIEQLKDECGCYIQMNSRTVMGEHVGFFQRRWHRELLKHELIDFVSSDAHSLGHRPICLAEAHQVLTEQYGQAYADRLCGGNAASMLGL